MSVSSRLLIRVIVVSNHRNFRIHSFRLSKLSLQCSVFEILTLHLEDIDCWSNLFRIKYIDYSFWLLSDLSIDRFLSLASCMWESIRFYLQRFACQFHLSFHVVYEYLVQWNVEMSLQKYSNCTTYTIDDFLISFCSKLFVSSFFSVCTEITIRETRRLSVICFWFTLKIKSIKNVCFSYHLKDIFQVLT